jgi:hypothetical protein
MFAGYWRPRLADILGSHYESVTLARSGAVSRSIRPGPRIEDVRASILRITPTAISGSDIHLYDGYPPTSATFFGNRVDHSPMLLVMSSTSRCVIERRHAFSGVRNSHAAPLVFASFLSNVASGSEMDSASATYHAS